MAGSNREAISISPYTGQLLGSIELPGTPALAPVVAGGSLFFLTNDATLVALR